MLENRRRVIIVRADHIGDLVLTTPLIRALAQADLAVELIAPRPAVSLLEENPHLTAIHDLREICPRWPRDWWHLTAHLRRGRYDVGIIPFAHPRQLLVASMLSGIRQRIAMWAGLPGRITGHTCLRSGYLDEARPYAETLLRVLAPLNVPPRGLEPEIYLTDAERQKSRERFEAKGLPNVRIGIHPISLGNACNLPPTVYVALAELVLKRTEWSVVFTGAPGDRALLPGALELEEKYPARCWVSCGELDLRGLAGVISELDALVVPSTGPLHIARALGIRTITPFCPQIPVCAGIWGHPPHDMTALLPSPPPCAPSEQHVQHCDFRGTITAADLFTRLAQTVAASSPRSFPKTSAP